jgi:hypothetical protein
VGSVPRNPSFISLVPGRVEAEKITGSCAVKLHSSASEYDPRTGFCDGRCNLNQSQRERLERILADQMKGYIVG